MTESTQPPESVESLLVTVAEAARMLSISRSKLYELMNDGRLHYIQLDGRRLIHRADIESFIDAHRVKRAS